MANSTVRHDGANFRWWQLLLFWEVSLWVSLPLLVLTCLSAFVVQPLLMLCVAGVQLLRGRWQDVIWPAVFVVALLPLATVALSVGILLWTSATWLALVINLAVFVVIALHAYGLTETGIGVAMHRLYSHRGFTVKTSTGKWAMVLAAVASVQDTILHWAKHHIPHHWYTDQSGDRYSPYLNPWVKEGDADWWQLVKGFAWSQVGWLADANQSALKPSVKKKLAKNSHWKRLKADSAIQFAEKHYGWLLLVFNLGVPVVFWLIILAVLVVFQLPVWGYLLLFVLAYQFGRCLQHGNTHFINSWNHMFGRTEHDPEATATNTVLFNLINGGEGTHSLHHKRPSSAVYVEAGHQFWRRILDRNGTIIWLMAELGHAEKVLFDNMGVFDAESGPSPVEVRYKPVV